jgi:hypothetical protein
MLGTAGSTATSGRLERGAGPATIGGVEVDARRDDLVDAVEYGVVEDHVRRRELALEMLHRARADDRRRDGRGRARTRAPAGSA